MHTIDLYVYSLEDNTHVATITGHSNEECEAKAADLNYDNGDHGWTYSPAFGLDGGLIENADAEKIAA
jgi:hypothetical protein